MVSRTITCNECNSTGQRQYDLQHLCPACGYNSKAEHNFSDQLNKGLAGEEEVMGILNSCGVDGFSTYQFGPNSKAPKMQLSSNEAAELTAPDLICFYYKQTFFAEVKTKYGWNNYKGRWTGFDYRLFLEYLQIKQLTGLPFYVFFNHKVKYPLGIYYVELENGVKHWDGTAPNGARIMAGMALYEYTTLTPLQAGGEFKFA